MRYEPGSYKVHLATARDVYRLDAADDQEGARDMIDHLGPLGLVCGIVEEVDYLEKQATDCVESLCAERDDLRAVLASLERAGGDNTGSACCPCCLARVRRWGDWKPNPQPEPHDPDCDLWRVMQKPPGSWAPR